VTAAEARRFASRAGEKLAFALDAFDISVEGGVCADFGCNVGGFTDCLLQRGAAKVYAVDTGYGTLAWTLRKHDRVVVMERTNALRCDVPEPVRLVTVDVAWTPQRRIVPAAMRWLDGPDGRAVSLLKPHYELPADRRPKGRTPLADADARAVCREVCDGLAADCDVRAVTTSPLRGKGGNMEFLLLLAPAGQSPAGARAC
jgi:23S rRNA (cytidine1920-2'-O)/16S rRNA (cytidine1409-2'-O)-methyltransferase